MRKCLLCILLLALPFSASAQRSECPPFNGATRNVLVNARLFDGPVAEQVELAPDNEEGATWDIRGYKDTGRSLILLCEYKNRTSLQVSVHHAANRCTFRGDKKRSAWCGE
jgi:hypothetical protein